MACNAEGARDPPGCRQLGAVALPVVHGQAVALAALPARDRQHGGRIHSAREEHDSATSHQSAPSEE